jgi:4-amino-4-deoxy-L-arabinose transferase-like glycosyltransferase
LRSEVVEMRVLARRVAAHYREALVLALGSLLLFYRLGEIPGIHRDEAWIFFRVQEIAAGSRPLDGMNSYTGPLHQYLLWPLFQLFGYRVEVLRGLSASLNLLLIVLAMGLARPLAPSPRWTAAVGLLLVTSPCFVLYSRFG